MYRRQGRLVSSNYLPVSPHLTTSAFNIMLLQVALDIPDAETIRRLLREIVFGVDIIELGTPLLIRYGTSIISEIKQEYPHKKILADLKIVDAGATESRLAFEAGANIVTVLGTAHQATLQNAHEQAKRAGGQIMADLITVPDIDTSVQLARTLDSAGMDYICLHTAFDIQHQKDSNLDLKKIVQVSEMIHQTGFAVAGGLNPQSIKHLVRHEPDILVVGEYITKHEEPSLAIRQIRHILENPQG